LFKRIHREKTIKKAKYLLIFEKKEKRKRSMKKEKKAERKRKD